MSDFCSLTKSSADGSSEAPFLTTDEEARQFERDYRNFPRKVQKRGLRGGPQSEPEDLEEAVLSRLRALGRQQAPGGFRCVEIAVRPTDGMSWSASAINRAVRANHRGVRLYYLIGRGVADGTPAIEDLLSTARLARLARRHKVTDSFGYASRGVTALIVLAAVAIGVLVSWLGPLAKADESSWKVLTRPSFFVTTAILAVLGVLSPNLLAFLRPETRQKAIKALHQDLTDGTAGSRSGYGEFLRSVGRELARLRHPRCVIVDGFELLDAPTKDMIRHYFTVEARPERAYELWVIFEDSDAALFRKQVIASQHPVGGGGTGFQRTAMYDQLLLDDDDRRRLAEYDEPPGQADLFTVSAIRHPERTDTSGLEAFFKDYRIGNPGRPEGYGPLEFFYLLAVTSGWEGVPWFATTFAGSAISDPNLKHIRSKVLTQLLPGTRLLKSELNFSFREVLSQFARYIELSSDGETCRIAPEPARFLAGHWAEYGLPPSPLAHLFWALFWYDRTGVRPVDAFAVRKLKGHLLKSRVPNPFDLPEAWRTEVATTVFEACLSCVRHCLQFSLLDDVPSVLELAALLIDPQHPELWSGTETRLRSLVWQTFAVLGDERVLSALLVLEPLGDGEPARNEEVVSTAMGVFFESLLRSRDGPLADVRALLPHARARDAVTAYATVRGLWLARALEDFAVMPFAFWIVAAEEGRHELQGLVRGALGRLHAYGATEPVVADFITVSLGLWCFTLDLIESPDVAVDPRDPQRAFLEDVLAETLLVAWHIRSEQESQQERYDLVVNTLVKDLLVVATACATLLPVLKGGDPAQWRSLGDLVYEVLREGLGLHVEMSVKFGYLDDEDVIGCVRQQLDLLQLTWANLGFEQLSSLMALRRSEFEAKIDRTNDRIALLREMATSIAEEMTSPGTFGVIANAMVAKLARDREEVASTFLVHAAGRALDGRLGLAFTWEICLLALGNAHSYNQNLDVVVGHLLAEPAVPIGRVVASLPERARAELALWLLNAARQSERPDLVEGLLDELRTWPSQVENPDVSRHIEEEIEVFALELEISRSVPDVDEVLRRWKGREEGSNYAMVLYLLLRSTSTPSSALVQRSVDLLTREHDRAVSSSTIFLATELADTLQWSGDPAYKQAVRVAIDVLVRLIFRWEPDLSVESNIDAFALLVKHDSANSGIWREHLARWDAIQLERDGLAKLPSLIASGRFFLLFWHYFTVLDHWGLQVDVETGDFHSRLKVSPDERERIVDAWQRNGANIPAPFVTAERGRVPSADFLVIGRFLFSAQWESDASFEDVRDQFNRAAAGAMPTLFGSVASLPLLPPTIADILKHHRDRFARPMVLA